MSVVMLAWLAGCSENTFQTLDGTTPTGDDDDDVTLDHSGWRHSGFVELPPADIVINEIMPANRSTISPLDDDTTPDWVEIVNVSNEPFDLKRLQLRNDAQDIWMGTELDGSIAPGEYFVLWLGTGYGDGVFTGWSLDKDGDKLLVIVDDRLQEEIEFDAIDGDISWARTPDLTGDWAATAWATPGRINRETASPTMNVADETWFVKDQVHQIRFAFTPEAYNQINQPDRPEVHVAMEIDGQVRYRDIGLKLKGSASYDTMDGKPAFIVDMNEWIPGTKFRGLQAFKLHNGNVLDPTRVRDHITYRLAREAGLMAPRVGWAEVWCNQNYYGIYMIIERQDDQFIKYFHPEQEDSGVVMEPNEAQGGGFGWGDFGQGNATSWNIEEGPNPPDPLSVRSLTMADQIIGRPPSDQNVAELWNYMDKDLLLTYLAWEALANHTDGYKSPNNWRVYIDGVNHLVSLLPSGAEWTWDGASNDWQFGGRAGSWCMSNTGCKHDYAEKVLEMADLVERLDLAGDFRDQSIFLDPIIQIDPRYNSWETPAQARESTWQYLNANPDTARSQVYQTFPDLRP
ncbi:MAG: CotH kinase family protein [Alphaproteobacteria bacterium]|nr:CotH kinase family protein [Alphaproteobacteria bacterium]MCB9695307.1 CotH kinase family protein [Alphaproteobacteria bacterium]